jgi:hypothetical protein
MRRDQATGGGCMATVERPGIPSVFGAPAGDEPAGMSADRVRARKRLEKKSKFRGDLVAYVVINAFLVVIWAVSGRGYFWPGWVLGGWAVFLALDAWGLYFRRPITEADIDRELHRHQ